MEMITVEETLGKLVLVMVDLEVCSVLLRNVEASSVLAFLLLSHFCG